MGVLVTSLLCYFLLLRCAAGDDGGRGESREIPNAVPGGSLGERERERGKLAFPSWTFASGEKKNVELRVPALSSTPVAINTLLPWEPITTFWNSIYASPCSTELSLSPGT